MADKKRVGVFFDGTGNHNKNDKGIDSSNSNVGRLLDKYDGDKAFYEKGVGTVDLNKEQIKKIHDAKGEDSFTMPWENGDDRSDYYSETAQALGHGMGTRVDNNLEKVKDFIGDNPDSELTIDVFGFSRGSAEARFFINKVNAYINEQKLQDKVKVGFVGIYDTVESDNVYNGRQGNINLNKDSAQKIVHFTAKDERRDTFDLTTLKDKDGKLASNMEEIEMIGVHSDVGGGYEFTKKGGGEDCDANKEQCYRAEPSFRKCLTASYLGGNRAILQRSLELNSFAKQHHYNILKKTRTFYMNSQAPALSYTEVCATMEHRVYDGLNNVHLNLMADKARESGVPLKEFSIDSSDYTYGVHDKSLKEYYKLKKENKPIPKELEDAIENKYVNDSTIGLMNFDNDSGVFDLDGKARDIRYNEPNEAVRPNKIKKQKDYGQDNHVTLPSQNKYDYVTLPSMNENDYIPFDYNKSNRDFLNGIKYKLNPNRLSQNSKNKRFFKPSTSSNIINVNLENKSQKLFKKLGLRHEKIPTLNHNQNLPEKIEGMYRKDDLTLKKNPRVSDKKAEAVAMHEIYHHTQKDKGLELGQEEAQANMIEKAYLNENQQTSQEVDFDLIYAYTIKQFYEHEELEQLVRIFGGDDSSARRVYSSAMEVISEYRAKDVSNNIGYENSQVKKVVGDSGVKYKQSDKNNKSTFKKIYDGLSKSFSQLDDRKGEILDDIGTAFKGAYDGTQEMLKEAPIYAKAPLYVAGAITAAPAAVPFAKMMATPAVNSLVRVTGSNMIKSGMVGGGINAGFNIAGQTKFSPLENWDKIDWNEVTVNAGTGFVAGAFAKDLSSAVALNGGAGMIGTAYTEYRDKGELDEESLVNMGKSGLYNAVGGGVGYGITKSLIRPRSKAYKIENLGLRPTKSFIDPKPLLGNTKANAVGGVAGGSGANYIFPRSEEMYKGEN